MTLDVVSKCGTDELATVFIAKLRRSGELIEMVESRQPPHALAEKWVLIVSTLMGCPVKCLMCDAGGSYQGKLTAQELMDQIEFLVQRRFAGLSVPVKKFKIQFARMGEPALNDAVLDVLTALPGRLDAPGLIPSVSTVAPHGREAFFACLTEIKNEFYHGGRFQMQFSVHSTTESIRDRIIPIKKWSLARIASFADTFFAPKDRKITLNFIACADYKVDAQVLIDLFDPNRFLIKITPLNPTLNADRHALRNAMQDEQSFAADWVDPLRLAGFKVLLSIGEWEENRIGSNCGQYVRTFKQSGQLLPGAYQYEPQMQTEEIR